MVIDIYPVGLLHDVQKAWRSWRMAGRPPREVLWPLVRWFGRSWHRRSYWNGYLAEPVKCDASWTRCGHGWTRRRAYADLIRHMSKVATNG